LRSGHYGAHIRIAKPGRRLDQRVKYRLQIEGRSADDLEHIGGRGLLLQRLAQLIEQAGVLDRDDGLGGERLHEFDLSVGEKRDLLTIEGDCADGITVA
jgi:hypothetical protein